jgi:hypothetical protein
MATPKKLPTNGPTTNTQKSAQLPEMIAGPSERAGLILHPSTLSFLARKEMEGERREVSETSEERLLLDIQCKSNTHSYGIITA